jgi:hypothetical protein
MMKLLGSIRPWAHHGTGADAWKEVSESMVKLVCGDGQPMFRPEHVTVKGLQHRFANIVAQMRPFMEHACYRTGTDDEPHNDFVDLTEQVLSDFYGQSEVDCVVLAAEATGARVLKESALGKTDEIEGRVQKNPGGISKKAIRDEHLKGGDKMGQVMEQLGDNKKAKLDLQRDAIKERNELKEKELALQKDQFDRQMALKELELEAKTKIEAEKAAVEKLRIEKQADMDKLRFEEASKDRAIMMQFLMQQANKGSGNDQPSSNPPVTPHSGAD